MVAEILFNPNLSKVKFEIAKALPVDFASAHIILFDNNNKIVLVREINDKYFNLPGGHREKQETSPQTAERECLEELGAKIDQGSLHYLGNLVLGNVIFPLFFIQGVDDIQYDLADFEIKSFDWMEFLGLITLINPDLAIQISQLIKAIIN